MFLRLFACAALALQLAFFPVSGPSCASAVEQAAHAYDYAVLPLERNGYKLHFDCMNRSGTTPQKNILLVHGLTYSSHEFDVNYGDYSLARFLADQGYAVWRLDVAGYGQSQAVEDGFLPNSDYAAEDVAAAAAAVVKQSGQKKIDVLGWSWGTVTSSRFAAKHPDMVRRLVLYAPILSGLGAGNVTSPFNNNTWVHAAGDFQMTEKGDIDYSIVEPAVVAEFQSNCWRYDGSSSPNGGRRDLVSDPSNLLIFPDQLKVPTFVIAGDRDPYINKSLFHALQPKLPAGSKVVEIKGAAHAMMMEKPFYKDFRNQVMAFLNQK